jgi:hypothetical protein
MASEQSQREGGRRCSRRQHGDAGRSDGEQQQRSAQEGTNAALYIYTDQAAGSQRRKINFKSDPITLLSHCCWLDECGHNQKLG